MTRRNRIVGGVVGTLGLLLAASVAPAIVGALLMTFSVLVFLFAVVGLAMPRLVRLPNRAAGVWVLALSIGLFISGGVLVDPPEEQTTASDARMDAIARARAAREADRQADIDALLARDRPEPVAELVTDSEAQREVCDLEPGRYVLDASRADFDADPMASAILITAGADPNNLEDGELLATAIRFAGQTTVQSDPAALDGACVTISLMTGIPDAAVRARLWTAE